MGCHQNIFLIAVQFAGKFILYKDKWNTYNLFCTEHGIKIGETVHLIYLPVPDNIFLFVVRFLLVRGGMSGLYNYILSYIITSPKGEAISEFAQG